MDAFLHETALLTHAQRTEPVEYGECLLTNQARDCLCASLGAGNSSRKMIDSIPQQACAHLFLLRQVIEFSQIDSGTVRLNAVDSLALRGELLDKQVSSFANDLL
jgi:hypothetical protein